jgi:UDP-glucuronate decarboxylase
MMDKIIAQDIEKIKDVVKGEIFSGKKILVTGGAGFLGSWLCDLLLSYNADVTAVDDLSTGRKSNIDHLENKLKFIKSNICKFESKEKFDHIFHMAAHASPEEYQTHSIETLQTSALGTFTMAELARKNDATLLFASTSEVYGDAEVIPTLETYWGNVNPVGPRSCYDEGKRFAEALLMAFSKQYGLDMRIPRIFNTYGPRLREDGLYGRAMSRFILQALTSQPITVFGDGKQTRSFCYVTDNITGLLLLTENPKVKGQVVNVGNTKEITVLQLAEKIKKATKSKSKIEFFALPKDDPKRRCPDTSKLQSLVGWKPNMPFEEGVERTVAWFSQNK